VTRALVGVATGLARCVGVANEMACLPLIEGVALKFGVMGTRCGGTRSTTNTIHSQHSWGSRIHFLTLCNTLRLFHASL
jgi:hypothetical protein